MLRARSLAEARLYIASQPCRGCGARDFAEPSRIVERGDRLGVACAGYCPKCGAARSFELELADARVPHDAWGGADASTLVDAGEWMGLADRYAERAPVARADLTLAIAALGEVLKFYAPGAADPPRSAFFTHAGRTTYIADPRRFARARIDVVLAAWRELADRLDRSD
jgi:hypothetical protein